MTCEYCAEGKKFTFNHSCRTCKLRWMKMVGEERALKWLNRYRELNGAEDPLKLLKGAKADVV